MTNILMIRAIVVHECRYSISFNHQSPHDEGEKVNLWFVEEGVVGGSLLGLGDAGCLPIAYHVDGLSHGLNALRVHEALVDRVHRFVRTDVAFSLHKSQLTYIYSHFHLRK